MHAQLLALIARVWLSLHAPHDAAIAEAIATACEEDAARGYADAPLEAAVMAVYSARESSNQAAPAPQAWDAWAHVSCGPWQLRCSLQARTVKGQARQWLWLLHRGSLAGLDSSPTRAARRLATASLALAP